MGKTNLYLSFILLFVSTKKKTSLHKSCSLVTIISDFVPFRFSSSYRTNYDGGE